MTDADLNALLEQIRAQTEAVNRLTNSLGKVSGDIGKAANDSKSMSSMQNKALEKIAKAQAQSQKNLENNINKMMSGAMRAMGQTRKSAMEKEVSAAKKASGGVLSAEKAQAARVAGATKHMERLGIVSLAASAGLQSLGKNALILGKQLGAGEATASSFTSAISNTVQSVTGFTKYLGKAGFVVSTVIETMAKFAVVAAEQGDSQFKVFKDLQKSGANTSDGLNGVNRLLGSFGLHVKDAGKMLQTISANAQGLVMFRGTVAEGAKAMGGVVKDLRDSGLQESLALIGISYDEQRESIASYITLQARLGKSQTMTNQQLARGAAEYLKEQDALTRLTGATRKEQEETRNRAMAEEQFRTRIERLKQQGPAGQAQAANLEKTYQILAAEYGKDIASQMGSLADGITTDFNKGLQILSGGRAGEIMTSGGTPEEIARALGPVLKDSMRSVGEVMGQTGQFRQQTGIDMGNLYDRLARGPLGERQARVQREQGGFAEGRGGVGGAVEIAEANIKTMRAMQDLVQLGVVPVMNAMGKLSKLIGNLAGGLSNLNPMNWFSGAEVPQFADGGIAKGPNSGHLAMLHGTEAVIPLKGGKVPLDFGAGLAKLTGGPTTGGTSTAAADLNKNIANMTKAMVPFTEALNNFTNSVKKTTATGIGEGEEARKGESMFDKMVSFIANLFGPGGTAGAPGGARGAPAADMTAAMNAHDASHKHEPPTITPAAAKELGAGLGSPLKDLAVTSGFGMRTDPITGKQAGHGGVDLAGKIGDAIMAPESGIARVVGEAQSGGYGNMVEILNEQGKVIHRLAHMSETMIKTGDKISAGSEIGKVGSTGRSTGAHLHWEQFDPTTGKQVDPLAALAAKQGRPGFGTTGGGAATGYPQMAPKTAPMTGGVKDNLAMMTRALQEQGITDPKMINATLANVMKETGGKINVEEDLAGYANTSNERIRSIFGARAAKKSDEELNAIKKDPKQFAEMMYGKDSGMGLGNVDPGDAYKFRGRGAVGLTGKANYAAASKDLFGDDRLVQNPELLQDPEMAAKTSAWFMKKNTGAMAQRMGMAGGPQTQEQANLLATSTIAGQAIRPGQGFLGQEALGKVTAYSAQLAGGQLPAGAVSPGTPPMVAGAPTAPGMPTTVAAAQSPLQSLLSSFLGPQIGGTIGGMAGPVLPGTPGAPSAPSDLVAAIKEQGAATSSAITTSIASLKDSIGTGTAGSGSQVPDLLNEMISAQRDQTAAINRLIQVQNA